MKQNQKRQKVLVTGAAGALGSVVAKHYLSQGFFVTGTAMEQEVVAELEEHSASEGKFDWVKVNLADPASVEAAFANLSFDIVIHCAGGFRFSYVEDLRSEDLEFLLDANLRSAFHLLRVVLPQMKKHNFGRIVLVSSQATLKPQAGLSAYEASKAGLNMLVASLGEEVKQNNININAVLPSMIDTPANRRDMPGQDFAKTVKTTQLAEIIFALTQTWGDPIHGALIPVSGRI